MHKISIMIAGIVLGADLLTAGGNSENICSAPIQEISCAPEWQYSGTLYGFAAGVSGESLYGREFEITFGDIIENLDFTLMGNLLAQNGQWSFGLDAIHLSMSKNIDLSSRHIPEISNIQLRSTVVTPMIGYKIGDFERGDLHLVAGARYLYIEPTITFSPIPQITESGSAWNAIVGFRGNVDFYENWFMRYYADIGAGDTEMIWQAFAGIGYSFGAYDVIAGYRYLEWDFEEDDKGGNIFYDLKMSGPIVGLSYRF